jgi:putative lipoprotein (rSAM/lipoprotein system)
MKRNWRKGIIGGLSFTSALFIFQACYGMPQDFYEDIQFSGQVKSKTTGKPIEGILVSLNDGAAVETSENGEFQFFSMPLDQANLRFQDVDGENNGEYVSKDTVITQPGEYVVLEIELEEK